MVGLYLMETLVLVIILLWIVKRPATRLHHWEEKKSNKTIEHIMHWCEKRTTTGCLIMKWSIANSSDDEAKD